MSSKTKPVNMRWPSYLIEFADAYAGERQINRTQLTTELVRALAEGRLTVRPVSGPNPFPADDPLFPLPSGQE